MTGSSWALGGQFAIAAAVSLGGSAILVTRLERLAERWHFTEALLGLVAALAADAPEITSAVAALAHGQRDIGVGVTLGSNAFNLAALLGVAALVSGSFALHRRVVLLSGAVGIGVAAVSVLAVTGVLGPAPAMLCVVVVLMPYFFLAAHRVPKPARVRAWLEQAVHDEEEELEQALRPRPGRRRDAVVAVGAIVVVVLASLLMERSGTSLGSRFGLSQIVVGGLILAAVTSIPNAVAAVYLAVRGRGAATLSTAMNSNTLNVAFGLLLPATVTGLGRSGDGTLVAAGYAGLTVLALGLAYLFHGLNRYAGLAIVVAYLGLCAALSV